MSAAAVVALSTLLESCAPNVGARTMTAIVRIESNANSLAIHDNTTRRSFAPRTVGEATLTARSLIDAGHSVDLGLGQVNSNNLAMLGLSVHDAFEPCANLHAGATILAAAYAEAAKRLGPGAYALRRAIGAYNTGSIFAGNAYIDRILIAAGLPAQNDRRVPDLETPAAVFAREPLPPVMLHINGVAPRPHAGLKPRGSSVHTVRATATPQPSANPYASALLVTDVAPTPGSTVSSAASSATVAPLPSEQPVPRPAARIAQ